MSDVATRCAADSRCVAWDSVARQPAWTDGAPLCVDCLTVCGQDIGRLVADYVALEQVLAPGSGGGEFVSGTRERPVPLRLGVEALQARMLHVLTTWEAVVRDVCGLSDSVEDGVRDGWAIQAAVKILEPRVRRLAALGATEVYPTGCEDDPTDMTGMEALLAMRDLHRDAHRMLGLTRKVNRLPGECPRCGLGTLVAPDGTEHPALARDNGKDEVVCQACGHWMEREEYERYAGLVVAWIANERRAESRRSA